MQEININTLIKYTGDVHNCNQLKKFKGLMHQKTKHIKFNKDCINIIYNIITKKILIFLLFELKYTIVN